MLDRFGRRYLSKPIGAPIARFIGRLGISPNQLTVLGFISALISAVFFANEIFFWAGVFLLISGTFDVLDGELAKVSKSVTPWGAYLDSMTDRYSDTIVLLGLAWYYTQANEVIYVLLVALAIAGALLVSYTKARAESIIDNFTCGLMERPERMILLTIGAFLEAAFPAVAMKVILWCLVFLVHLTAIHRIIYTYKRIKTPIDTGAE